VLLVNEPSVGLTPQLVSRTFEHVERVREAGTAVLVVEQNVRPVLQIADRGYILEGARTASRAPPRSCSTVSGSVTSTSER
jgi:branched-chain amino acid transport system ATP-binding protein